MHCMSCMAEILMHISHIGTYLCPSIVWSNGYHFSSFSVHFMTGWIHTHIQCSSLHVVKSHMYICVPVMGRTLSVSSVHLIYRWKNIYTGTNFTRTSIHNHSDEWVLSPYLLLLQVNQSHQGRYSCTPYNRHTTAGSSGDMEVRMTTSVLLTGNVLAPNFTIFWFYSVFCNICCRF